MSVTIRPYQRGGWEVDVRVVTLEMSAADFCEQKRAPVTSRNLIDSIESTTMWPSSIA